MKVKEVCKMLDDGAIIPVQFKERINEFEGRYEKDMRTYLTGYKIDGDNADEYQVVIFSTEQREYSESNKSIEKPIWWNDETRTYNLTWSESWIKENPNEDIYENSLESEIETFETLNDESLVLFNLYQQSNSDLRYVSWLEKQLVKYTDILSKL